MQVRGHQCNDDAASLCYSVSTARLSGAAWSVQTRFLPKWWLDNSTTTMSVNSPFRLGKPVRAQELCESRGGRPGLPVPNKPHGFCGRKASLNWTGRLECQQRPVTAYWEVFCTSSHQAPQQSPRTPPHCPPTSWLCLISAPHKKLNPSKVFPPNSAPLLNRDAPQEHHRGNTKGSRYLATAILSFLYRGQLFTTGAIVKTQWRITGVRVNRLLVSQRPFRWVRELSGKKLRTAELSWPHCVDVCSEAHWERLKGSWGNWGSLQSPAKPIEIINEQLWKQAVRLFSLATVASAYSLGKTVFYSFGRSSTCWLLNTSVYHFRDGVSVHPFLIFFFKSGIDKLEWSTIPPCPSLIWLL